MKICTCTSYLVLYCTGTVLYCLVENSWYFKLSTGGLSKKFRVNFLLMSMVRSREYVYRYIYTCNTVRTRYLYEEVFLPEKNTENKTPNELQGLVLDMYEYSSSRATKDPSRAMTKQKFKKKKKSAKHRKRPRAPLPTAREHASVLHTHTRSHSKDVRRLRWERFSIRGAGWLHAHPRRCDRHLSWRSGWRGECMRGWLQRLATLPIPTFSFSSRWSCINAPSRPLPSLYALASPPPPRNNRAGTGERRRRGEVQKLPGAMYLVLHLLPQTWHLFFQVFQVLPSHTVSFSSSSASF